MGYSRALLTSELETIFAQAPLAPNSVAHPHVREAHARATGKAPTTSMTEEAGSKNKRIPSPEDDCPICYDGMHGVAEALLVFCEECGNALHKECFQQCGSFTLTLWTKFSFHFFSFSGQRTAASNGKGLTCVWCRARWIIARPGGGAAGSAKSMGRYINLSDVADVSPVRDTSTCKSDPPQNVRYAHIPFRLSRS